MPAAKQQAKIRTNKKNLAMQNNRKNTPQPPEYQKIKPATDITGGSLSTQQILGTQKIDLKSVNHRRYNPKKCNSDKIVILYFNK